MRVKVIENATIMNTFILVLSFYLLLSTFFATVKSIIIHDIILLEVGLKIAIVMLSLNMVIHIIKFGTSIYILSVLPLIILLLYLMYLKNLYIVVTSYLVLSILIPLAHNHRYHISMLHYLIEKIALWLPPTTSLWFLLDVFSSVSIMLIAFLFTLLLELHKVAIKPYIIIAKLLRMFISMVRILQINVDVDLRAKLSTTMSQISLLGTTLTKIGKPIIRALENVNISFWNTKTMRNLVNNIRRFCIHMSNLYSTQTMETVLRYATNNMVDIYVKILKLYFLLSEAVKKAMYKAAEIEENMKELIDEGVKAVVVVAEEIGKVEGVTGGVFHRLSKIVEKLQYEMERSFVLMLLLAGALLLLTITLYMIIHYMFILT